MTRLSRTVFGCLLLAAAASTPANKLGAQEPETPPSPPAAPAPAPAPKDPLEEFIPHEKVKADSIVALPVDI